MKQPLETGSYTSRSTVYSTCATTLPSSPTLPCFDEEKNTSLYSSAVSHTFYDAQGRAVETRTPGPTPGDDTVVMTVYNDQNNSVWKSVSFQVADGSGWIDPNGAKDINGIAPAGTTTFSDALGRTIATKDPNFGSAQESGSNCSSTLSGSYTTCSNYSFAQAMGDSNVYALTASVDPNGHVTQSFTDELGNVRYTQTYSGGYSELAMSLTFNGTGSWTNVQTVTTSVTLQAGNNTILFSNPNGAEPNIDRITIGSTSYEAEASSNTLLGSAIVQGCAPCSGGQQVGWIVAGSGLQFNNINVASAGTYPLTIAYTEGGSTVTGMISINGQTLTKQTQTQYNALNKPISIAVVDEQPQSGESPTSVTTTMTYDDLGRMLTENDPDQGNFSSTYNPDGHVLSVTQTSGSNTRTLRSTYDLYLPSR